MAPSVQSLTRAGLGLIPLIPAVTAILVAPGSPCSKDCGNVLQSDSIDDMICIEAAYLSSSAGQVFEKCTSCLLKSSYYHDGGEGNQTDLQAVLYNLRFALSVCLLGYLGEKPGSNPCTTSKACEPLQNSIEFGNLSTSSSEFEYCHSWYHYAAPNCEDCLHASENGHYLANFVVILDAACQQQPAKGGTVAIQGSPFSNQRVNATQVSASNLATVPLPNYGHVSLGARVGIVFGGLAFILAVTGFGIVWKGKRRRRALLRQMEKRQAADQGWPHLRNYQQDMFETPASQKPLRGWDESPVSAQTDATLPRYFSPYSSQFNSPVNADGRPSAVTWPALPPQQPDLFAPSSSGSGPGLALRPTVTQGMTLMQASHDHQMRQQEVRTELALGRDDPSLRSNLSNPSMDKGIGGSGRDVKRKQKDNGS